MKRILAQNNSVVLQEIQGDGSIILQLGYALGGVTYKIENNNVKFYLKDDYFYKNCIFSADLPLNINGTEYDEEHIAEAMGSLFPTNGGSGGGDVTSVNGKTGAVTLTAEDVDAYTKDEVDDLIDGLETEIDGIGEELNNYYNKTQVDTALDGKQDKLTAGQNITIDANNVISATGGGGMEQVQSDWNQSDSTKVDYIKNKPTIPTVPTNVSAFTNDAGYLTQHQSLANYYTKAESDDTFAFKFTDVVDIVMVSQLPSQPKAGTLYLIPVQ